MRAFHKDHLIAALGAASSLCLDATQASSKGFTQWRNYPIARQPLEAADLARLRDIGSDAPEASGHTFTLSPDGTHIAFQVREADPTLNIYHLQMYIVASKPGATPLLVDQGGEFIRRTNPGVGGVIFESGSPKTITVQWSSDGTAIFFLKRINGRTQIWRAAADGSGSAPLIPGCMNIDDFVLSVDAKRLVFACREPDPEAVASLTQEALAGYRFDGRFIPLYSSRPFIPSATRSIRFAMDIQSSKVAPASIVDSELLDPTTSSAPSVSSSSGHRAWTVQHVDAILGGAADLYAQDGAGKPVRCAYPVCAGAHTIWWDQRGTRVYYTRREGWADSKTAIYQWVPGRRKPIRLFATDDWLIDCQPAGPRVLCLREQSIVPRQIVSLDPKTGNAVAIFDPNANFSRFSLGKVERLHWTSGFGVEAFGDLVYPVDYVAGRRYPLVVVQYISRGFLRGGTGDEFPIQVFANHGYVVLSVQRPDPASLVKDATSRTDLERRLLTGFKDRRNVLSAIEVAVRSLIERGIADPHHIGITGLSDGSSTVQFALMNSRTFSAASAAACCWDPFQDAMLGPAIARSYHEIGWPLLSASSEDFWKSISIIQNANRIDVPILIQQSDRELGAALASYTALRQAGKPASLYVFPDEYHIKWQPAHRLAIYNRNLKWFDFWLRGIGNKDDLISKQQ